MMNFKDEKFSNSEQVCKKINMSIEKAADMEYYPLSAVQRGNYLIHSDNATTFNTAMIVVIEGSLDLRKFESAIKEIVNRHDAFRTGFFLLEEEPVQKIYKELDFQLKYIESTTENEMEVISDFIKPFDLKMPPLARACIIRTKHDRHTFVFDMHHIITDARTAETLVDEMINLYRGNVLPELKIQYKDFAVWNKKFLQTELAQGQKKYWLEKFSGEIPKLAFPSDFSTGPKDLNKGNNIEFSISPSITLDLKKFIQKYIRKYNITLNTVLFSIYTLLMHKYSHQDDIIIGTISEGRNHNGLENMVGSFINVIPVRIKIKSKNTFFDLLNDVTTDFIEAYENQDYPIEEIIQELSISRENALNPLFDTMFVFHGRKQNSEFVADKTNLKLLIYNYKNNYESFGIQTDIFFGSKDELIIKIEYNALKFSRIKMEKMAEHFQNLVEYVIKNPEKKLIEIDMLSQREKNSFDDYNNTFKDYSKYVSLGELFEAQVKKSPDAVALIYEDACMTYRELNEKSNKVAWFLSEKGIKENDVIGVMTQKSFEMIIGILGILKVGAAYVPIDTDYPKERIDYILENSNVQIVLCNDILENISIKYQKEVIIINDVLRMESLPVRNMVVEYNPNRLMYILYTSGSTGNPKGAMVKAHAFINLLEWFVDEFKINANDCNLLIASISFDLAQKNLYATLITGGSLCLYPKGLLDYNVMSDIIAKKNITIINSAPGVFYPILDFNSETNFQKLSSLRYVFLGGEAINIRKLLQWVKSENYKGEIVNTYGPTECTDIATFFRLTEEHFKNSEAVPIGKPINNVQVYIMDNDMNLVPEGVDGEIYIGGVGVAKGYHNDQKLTDEKFVQCSKLSSSKIYRTGDLARRMSDGNILFRGRIDHQVKINGCRIEIEEIKNALLKHSLVKDVVVVDYVDQNDSAYLCAYLVCDIEIQIQELRDFLRKRLPNYMIPSYFICLDNIPLSVNGKVDRKFLPIPDIKDICSKKYIDPANETEEMLMDIWRKVLKVENFGVTDDFFAIGASSLKLIVGASQINKDLQIKVPLDVIFREPTVRAISDYILSELSDLESDDFDDIDFNF